MNTKLKELYEAPVAMAVEVNIDAGIMQTSNYNYGDLNEPDNVMNLLSGQPVIF